MSLRNLPRARAPKALSGVEWDLSEKAGARWSPGVRAAEADDAATISIYEQIGEDWWTGEGWTAKRVAGALRAIGSKPVTVNLNSPGGDLFEGLAIYNLLRDHPAEVTVKVVGVAASAASVIAMAGDTIHVGRAAMLMIHNAWGVVVGNRHDMRELADVFDEFDGLMVGLYDSRCGAGRDQVAAWMDAETWFAGERAVEVGLADALLPADAVEEGAPASAAARAQAARRRLDQALAKGEHLSRGERRALLRDLGTPGAAEAPPHKRQPAEPEGSNPVMPSADAELSAAIRACIETLS